SGWRRWRQQPSDSDNSSPSPSADRWVPPAERGPHGAGAAPRSAGVSAQRGLRDEGADETDRDTGQRSKQVVLGEPPVLELLEASERLGGDDKTDPGERSAED